MKRENAYQSGLIKKLKKEFPESIVLKNDSEYIQGIPDLLILLNDKWAALEVKRSSISKLRPNQQYYLDKMNTMGGYARLIFPENETEVFNELREISRSRR